MRLYPRDTQAFRGHFTYQNSSEAIRRFPFPFPEDDYIYSVNIEPHVLPGPEGSVYEHMLDIDEHYLSETAERDMVLREDPDRCLAMPHMRQACWDLLEFVMTHYARDYPQHFSFERQGDDCVWVNHPLNIRQSFRMGEEGTLPTSPWSSSAGRCREISHCSISATATCSWMPASSPHRPTGRWPLMRA